MHTEYFSFPGAKLHRFRKFLLPETIFGLHEEKGNLNFPPFPARKVFLLLLSPQTYIVYSQKLQIESILTFLGFG